MHHQRLRQQAFNEPAGLEQGLHVFAVSAEHKPHQRKGRHVKNGRGRANPDHKAADVSCIPLARFAQELFVRFVPRQRELGDVVHQVLQQQLDREHRQERNERAGHQYREHVAEVGAGGHVQVFHNVAKGLAAFDNAFFQHHQALFQQDDVGRFLGDIGATVDRDTHVGIAQSRGIVNAVTKKAHRMTVGLQRLQHA